MACESVLGDRSLVAGDVLLLEHFDLPATRLAPRRARKLVRDTLEGSSAPDGAAEVAHIAQLLVSELVTNAVMHARTDLHLGITGDARTLLFTVADGHPNLPPDTHRGGSAPEEPDVDYEESGRGLSIVIKLATDFGWRLRDDTDGKVMWCTLAIPPRT